MLVRRAPYMISMGEKACTWTRGNRSFTAVRMSRYVKGCMSGLMPPRMQTSVAPLPAPARAPRARAPHGPDETPALGGEQRLALLDRRRDPLERVVERAA